MILPCLLLVIVFNYLPLYGILIAFKHFNVFKGVLGSPWARDGGFEHFIDFFQSPNVAIVLRNTVAIALLKLVFLSFPPVLFAIFLNEIGNRPFKLVTQTISYLPHFISWVVLGGIMVTFFLRTPDAPFNRLLFALGAIESPTDVLNRPGYVWPVFVLSHLWKEVGWSAIIYLAVIASIDAELYEAAEVDGGGRLVKMLNITWPALKGTFMILFILACGQIMAGSGRVVRPVVRAGNGQQPVHVADPGRLHRPHRPGPGPPLVRDRGGADEERGQPAPAAVGELAELAADRQGPVLMWRV